MTNNIGLPQPEMNSVIDQALGHLPETCRPVDGQSACSFAQLCIRAHQTAVANFMAAHGDKEPAPAVESTALGAFARMTKNAGCTGPQNGECTDPVVNTFQNL